MCSYSLFTFLSDIQTFKLTLFLKFFSFFFFFFGWVGLRGGSDHDTFLKWLNPPDDGTFLGAVALLFVLSEMQVLELNAFCQVL